MKLIGECSITKKKAKKKFEYPMVRFPKEFRYLIGKKARIYRIDEKNFLVSLELHNQLSNSKNGKIERKPAYSECRGPGSNRRPSDLQSDALPAELPRLNYPISFFNLKFTNSYLSLLFHKR